MLGVLPHLRRFPNYMDYIIRTMDSGVIAMSSLINTTLTVTLFVHVTLTSPDSELVFKELRLSFWLSSSVLSVLQFCCWV